MQNKSLIYNIRKGISGRMRSLFKNPYKKVNLSRTKLKYYKHLPPGQERKHLLFGKAVYFHNPMELLHAFKEIFIDDIYKQTLPANPYIIDCGANIGMSVIYLKRAHPTATIVAFEPDERNFALLEKNIASQGLENVTLRKEAIWKENTTLHFSNEATMSSRIEEKSTGIEVKATRLKDMLNRPVDFLKIDIEGAEFEVLCDIAEKLDAVDNLFIEYHGYFNKIGELTKIFSIITNGGFAYYIKEATSVYDTPFDRPAKEVPFDIQLNIFCFRKK